ncbi:hypothetical protein AGRA3207_002744 [Actinomadura graeca]|uniref:DUF5753 domain-containing protein n=1 Tax=Actinomadura graeca TaxID=2750812 RepID=A0ABX8QT82_9ACTN|nr:DUF5753 domain-containing protein [Actinomadura graeca]QXJ21843.1 hypothetical protein AGRA3207_002744 [Actinomadura graeca]
MSLDGAEPGTVTMKRIDGMPDEDRGSDYAQVLKVLVFNRSLAADPPYLRIDKVSLELARSSTPVHGVQVVHLPRSTANELMRGKPSRVRKLHLVESCWATIFEIAVRDGRDVTDMVPLADLRLHHQVAGRPPRPKSARPAQAGAADAAREALDGVCGASAVATYPGAPCAGPSRGTTGGRIESARILLLTEARERAEDAWWNSHRDVVPDYFEIYLTLEPGLSVIRTYAPSRIPGLLQTELYAHTMIALDLPEISVRERERMVALRMRRQEILHRPDPPRFWAVIDERALRTTDSMAFMMRSQLRHLIVLAQLEHVTIQLIHEESAQHAVTEGPITIMKLPESGTPDLVYIEQAAHGLYPHLSQDVDYFVHAVTRLAIKAWPAEESLERLRGMLDELENTDG